MTFYAYFFLRVLPICIVAHQATVSARSLSDVVRSGTIIELKKFLQSTKNITTEEKDAALIDLIERNKDSKINNAYLVKILAQSGVSQNAKNESFIKSIRGKLHCDCIIFLLEAGISQSARNEMFQELMQEPSLRYSEICYLVETGVEKSVLERVSNACKDKLLSFYFAWFDDKHKNMKVAESLFMQAVAQDDIASVKALYALHIGRELSEEIFDNGVRLAPKNGPVEAYLAFVYRMSHSF
jgi:hypothetical protein